MSIWKMFGVLGVMASVATAQVAVHAVANQLVEEAEDYYPAQDTEAYFGQNLIDALETNLWGTALGSDVWNLDLEQPLSDTDRFATGSNRSGLPFEIEFASLTIVHKTDHSVGIWSGRLSAIGDFWCYGIYFAQNGFATLIPVYSRVDQVDLATLLSYAPRRWQCVLDVTGVWQVNQANITAIQCIQEYKDKTVALIAACTGGHWIACLGTFGLGCWTGPACLMSIAINDWLWGRSYDREYGSTMSCICNDVTFRNTFPSVPTPATISPCSKFECPSLLLGIKY